MERGRVFFFVLFSLIFRACFLFLQITKKTNNKNNFFFPHNGVRSWLAYPESLCFQVFSLFLICRDRTRCMEKSVRSQEDKKKTFPYCFWFSMIVQGARQRAYAVRKNNSLRLKHKISHNKLIKYERFKKTNLSLWHYTFRFAEMGVSGANGNGFWWNKNYFPIEMML